MSGGKSLKGGMKSYWKKRNYSRLHRPPPATVLLGSAPDSTNSAKPRRTRFWAIPRRIRFLRRIGSPKRWLARLRDAYVNMMLRFANSTPLGYGYGYGFGPTEVAFGPQRWKEYDEKVLVDIYKKLLISQGAVVSAEAAAAPAAVRS